MTRAKQKKQGKRRPSCLLQSDFKGYGITFAVGGVSGVNIYHSYGFRFALETQGAKRLHKWLGQVIAYLESKKGESE